MRKAAIYLLSISIILLCHSFSFAEPIDLVETNFSYFYAFIDADGNRIDLDPVADGYLYFRDDKTIDINFPGANSENEEKWLMIGYKNNYDTKQNVIAKLTFQDFDGSGDFQFGMYFGDTNVILRRISVLDPPRGDYSTWPPIDGEPLFDHIASNSPATFIIENTFHAETGYNDITLRVEENGTTLGQGTYHYPNQQGNIAFYILAGSSSGSYIKTKITELDIEPPIAPAPPSYKVGGFLMHRVLEDGTAADIVVARLFDEQGHDIAEEELADIKLFRSDGTEVTLVNIQNVSRTDAMIQYNCETSQWIYPNDQDGNIPLNYKGVYIAELSKDHGEQLTAGTYTVRVIDKTGNFHDKQMSFSGAVELPLVSSKSFKYKFDKEGNLIWTWDVPYYLDPSLETQVTASLQAFENDVFKSWVYFTAPSHLGRLLVPADIIERIKQEGDEIRLGVYLRTNDNNNRSQSNKPKLFKIKEKIKKTTINLYNLKARQGHLRLPFFTSLAKGNKIE